MSGTDRIRGFALYYSKPQMTHFPRKNWSYQMNRIARHLFILLIVVFPTLSQASIKVGTGKADITPPIGTPSAGYTDRKGEGMEGIHDPFCYCPFH